MIVRVPASSANLGAGFDALGMALSLHLEVALAGDVDGAESTDDAPRAETPTHPAVVAFRRLGGTGDIVVRSPIPMGRGLGFSGAARIGGLVAAVAQREGTDVDISEFFGEILAEATALEGHADNVAASLMGGVVATAGGRAVQVPLAHDPTIVVWVPGHQTSTDDSRGALPATVPLADAVFNIGRSTLLIAALAAGDIGSLREATADRLHQDMRFSRSPASRVALDAALDAGAWCGWLSGSGPTVAAMVSVDRAEQVANAMPTEGGHTKILRIDHSGASIEV